MISVCTGYFYNLILSYRTGQEANKRLNGELEILENQLEDLQDDNDRKNDKIHKMEKDMRDMRVQLEHKIELGQWVV